MSAITRLGSAAGDGGDDADRRAVRRRRLQSLGEAHVVLADVDVDEPTQLAVVVEDACPDAGVLGVELVEELGQGRRAVDRDLRLTAGQRAQDRRHPHGHSHYASPASRNDSNDALIVAVGCATGATASSVFSPSPVLRITVSASGSSRPDASSLRSVATVTPPAVSANTPSVRASSWIPSTISSSLTSAIAPPVRRTTSSAYGPSAGLPMASDFAMVDGRTGCTTSWPAAKAAETGEHPVACAPKTLYAVPSSRSSSDSSRHALSTLVSSAPDATGMTTCPGSRQPSCSAIS